MAIHISKLNIERYRGIRNVEIENMNQINIFTGSNNSGKTSILEVLCLICDPLKISVWFNIAYEARLGGKSTYTELLRMFPLDGEKTIDFSYYIDGEEHHIDAVAQEVQSSVPKDELMRLNGYIATGARKIENSEMLDMMYLALKLKYDSTDINVGVYEHQTRIIDNIEIPEDFLDCYYISQAYMVGGYLDVIRNVLQDNHYREIMINVLQQFDSNIESISLIGDELFVHAKNHRHAYPLGIYGAGMKKAVYILSAVIKTKDGIVIIDEFETGIHEEAMQKIFSLIFDTAFEQNVQLFMTTHNTAAVERVLDLKNYTESINLYTLYNSSKEQLVRRLSGNEIDKAIELGVAIR